MSWIRRRWHLSLDQFEALQTLHKNLSIIAPIDDLKPVRSNFATWTVLESRETLISRFFFFCHSFFILRKSLSPLNKSFLLVAFAGLPHYIALLLKFLFLPIAAFIVHFHANARKSCGWKFISFFYPHRNKTTRQINIFPQQNSIQVCSCEGARMAMMFFHVAHTFASAERYDEWQSTERKEE